MERCQTTLTPVLPIVIITEANKTKTSGRPTKPLLPSENQEAERPPNAIINKEASSINPSSPLLSVPPNPPPLLPAAPRRSRWRRRRRCVDHLRCDSSGLRPTSRYLFPPAAVSYPTLVPRRRLPNPTLALSAVSAASRPG